GLDLNFILMNNDEFKKWREWFYGRMVTKNNQTSAIPRPTLSVIYEHRSNMMEKTFNLGQGMFTLVFDNHYSTITDKTITFSLVSRWNMTSPSSNLPVINKTVIELPSEVYEPLSKANESYIHGHFEQCTIMLRKAIDYAIRLKLLQSGIDENELNDKDGNEIRLSEKIKILKENGLLTQKIAKYLDDVKWYGDHGAHTKMKFVVEDIRDNIEPKIRAFLTGLNLKV
ncbi:MAG: DUF4145 domain-containing protein, partial [Nitrosotalea sp.]